MFSGVRDPRKVAAVANKIVSAAQRQIAGINLVHLGMP